MIIHMSELEDMIRADMKANGKVALPLGGSARVELGYIDGDFDEMELPEIDEEDED